MRGDGEEYDVSILSRLVSRELLAAGGGAIAAVHLVSILSRLVSRELRRRSVSASTGSRFQSSPGW